MVVAVDCDGDGKERSETALGVTGVQKRKQGAECGTNSVQYYRPVLQDGVKECYPGYRNRSSEPSGAPRSSERDFFAAVSGR